MSKSILTFIIILAAAITMCSAVTFPKDPVGTWFPTYLGSGLLSITMARMFRNVDGAV